MPEKSVREMSELERKHYSLEARMFHASVMICVVLGIAALIVGLGLYAYALASQYITESFQLSRNTAAALTRVVDISPMSERTMELYHSQTENERAETGTDDYRARFAEISEMLEYRTALEVLNVFYKDSDVYDLYLAMYDADTSALVFIADPDENPDYMCRPGDWESVDKKEIKSFLEWDGEGKLYHIGVTEAFGRVCTAGVPIRNDNGEIVAFVLSDITLKNVATGMRNFTLQFLLALIVITALMSYILTQHMKRTLVKPINEIAEAAQKYVEDRRAGRNDTNHFEVLNIRTGDEVENLSLVMADMERDLSEYEENLTKVTAEKERVSTELHMATQIQEAMLPNIYPAFPDRPEFDIYATMDPAREVGGDFYDYFLIDDDHLYMLIADVSGKGIPAALFMMASKIILGNNAKMGKSPAKILEDTNASICSNNKMEMFVTVWLGVLEISTGKLTAANAGHEYPTIRHADGSFELIKDKHGFVIGGMSGVKYKEYELQMEPGSKLFVYTDGVPEATDAENNMFGTDRMLEALNKDPNAAPDGILKNVRNAVDGFVKEAEQFDDLTMLCLEYKLSTGGATTDE